MDWMKMPPMAALRAFAAFAEQGGLVEAGASLNVSHAAISQQLRALEAHLGVPLVERQGRNLVLTPAGDRLAQALHLGFGVIPRGRARDCGAGRRPAAPYHLYADVRGQMAECPGLRIFARAIQRLIWFWIHPVPWLK